MTFDEWWTARSSATTMAPPDAREAWEAAAAAEREACAKVCDYVSLPYQAAGASVAIECAAQIRMRSNVKVTGA